MFFRVRYTADTQFGETLRNARCHVVMAPCIEQETAPIPHLDIGAKIAQNLDQLRK